jgi:hypothetical protein
MKSTTARQTIPASDILSAPMPLPPAIIAPLVSSLKWERMFEFSGHMVSQLRRLGSACEPVPGSKFELIVDDPSALTPIAAAHAWMIAMAQPAALEMRRMEEMLDGGVMPASNSVAEVAAMAILAGCTNPRGSGRLLTLALQRLAQGFAKACHKRGLNGQFCFAKPLQSVSPVTHHTAVPMAACRLRVAGLTAAQSCELLKELVHNHPELGGGEVLVLSAF